MSVQEIEFQGEKWSALQVAGRSRKCVLVEMVDGNGICKVLQPMLGTFLLKKT